MNNEIIRKIKCPACESENIKDFFIRENSPVFQNALYKNRSQAIHAKCDKLDLKMCSACGMIHNYSFNGNLVDYNTTYENSQFNSDKVKKYFHEIIEIFKNNYGVCNTTIVEIGCGDGQFLSLLAKETYSKGIGYDPSFSGDLNHLTKNGADITIKTQYFDSDDLPKSIGLLICRHTIEHIVNPSHFLKNIYKILFGNYAFPPNHMPLIIFETPSLEWILKNNAFYDFFYEHCNYFTKESLLELFNRAGFDVLEIKQTFGDQYQIVFAKPKLYNLTLHYKFLKETKENQMEQRLSQYKNIAIWGAGAKGVTIASSIKNIACCIDINPKKQNRFTPKTAIRVLSPENALKEYTIDCVLVMNPNYLSEIKETLSGYPTIDIISIV